MHPEPGLIDRLPHQGSICFLHLLWLSVGDELGNTPSPILIHLGIHILFGQLFLEEAPALEGGDDLFKCSAIKVTFVREIPRINGQRASLVL